MQPAEDSLLLRVRKRWLRGLLRSAFFSPRVRTYIASSLLALSVSCLLGKDMSWDTLDYHFYAGFSALHDRFSLDYFPAGSQSYFNPYIYVPFYLLASSRLPALLDASILAFAQSGILWLTYEIALQLAPREEERGRNAMAGCSVLLAFANPILINQFGSSFADVITAELVVAGWLLLLLAVTAPSTKYVVVAALLLGVASALKLTNSVHALSAGVLLLFVRAHWSARLRYTGVFGGVLLLSFAMVCLPWSLRLEQHFGNPLFPVLNGVFHSPQFPSTKMLDYRFIPDSVAEALWRPFELAKPVRMTDYELPAPDCRYAVLLAVSILLALRWTWQRRARTQLAFAVPGLPHARGRRALGALGSAFAADWFLWLAASGNGRYFLPAACIAAVLTMAMIFRLCEPGRPRAYAAVAVVCAQVLLACWGGGYRDRVPWDSRPWFEVRLPASLPQAPALFLSYGVQSNAFIVPFLPSGSGFINIAGDFPLGLDGANGARVRTLIHRYSPHLMVLARDDRPAQEGLPEYSGIPAVADALESLALRAVQKSCSTFEIADETSEGPPFTRMTRHTTRPSPRTESQPPESTTGYLVACGVVPYPDSLAGLTAGKRRAEAALDRLEDACPRLFQPARPLTQYFGTVDHQEIWSRRYLNTNLTAWVSRGRVAFIDPLRGTGARYVAPEAELDNPRVRIECGRKDQRYFVKVVGSTSRPQGD